MAPTDLLTMLIAPFGSLKALQVPALTNALVSVCGDVLAYYAALLRSFVTSVGDDVLQGGGSGGTVAVPLPTTPSIAGAAVCAVLNNAERTIEMIDQLGAHVDAGEDDEEEEVSLGAHEPPAPCSLSDLLGA